MNNRSDGSGQVNVEYHKGRICKVEIVILIVENTLLSFRSNKLLNLCLKGNPDRNWLFLFNQA